MLQVAIVGTGYWGPNLASSIARTANGRLRWLCDTNSENLATLAKRHPSAKTTTDFAEVLADSSLDAVFIATPTATHHALAKHALEAGKHVLVEKPITNSSQQAIELMQLAAGQHRVLMVGHVFEYNSGIQVVDSLIKSGELGEIYYMNFERTNLGPVRTDVDALWDLATHDASIMCSFMGTSPTSVTARGQSYLNAGINDVIFATFTFGQTVMAHVHVSWLNPRKVRQITVVGSKKMVVWDDLDIQEPVRLYDKRVGPALSEITGTYLQHKTSVFDHGVTVPVVQSQEPLLTEIEHFFSSILSKQPPRSDGASGLRVVSLIEAAAESIANNSVTVSVRPVSF
jgi:predicted dehydrogenase